MSSVVDVVDIASRDSVVFFRIAGAAKRSDGFVEIEMPNEPVVVATITFTDKTAIKRPVICKDKQENDNS